jgi:hypothetical protein
VATASSVSPLSGKLPIWPPAVPRCWHSTPEDGVGPGRTEWERARLGVAEHDQSDQACALSGGGRDLNREPQVVAADVYALAPHIGRGVWSWYTGSAAWMWRLIVESRLGLRREGEQLRLVPCLPNGHDSWQPPRTMEGATAPSLAGRIPACTPESFVGHGAWLREFPISLAGRIPACTPESFVGHGAWLREFPISLGGGAPPATPQAGEGRRAFARDQGRESL